MSRAKQAPAVPSFPEALARLQAAGFNVESPGPQGARVSKHGCAAVLENSASGPRLAAAPGLVVGPRIAQLVDRGFQKFWQDGNQKRPALARELRSLHDFQQQLRAALGLTTLYNEALGTVSAHYVYDRVEGREQGPRHPSF